MLGRVFGDPREALYHCSCRWAFLAQTPWPLQAKTKLKLSAERVSTHARAGSNNTIEAISLTKHAKEVGADACLIVNPYYNKPTQEGLYQHFKKIGEECDQPIVLYVGDEAKRRRDEVVERRREGEKEMRDETNPPL